MGRRPVAYDITRLVTRILSRTPNGIDRVDFAFAEHFLRAGESHRSGLMMTALGPRVLPPEAARHAIENIRKHWGEDARPESDPHLAMIARAIDDRSKPTRQFSKGRRGQYGEAFAWLRQHGFPIGRAPRDFLFAGGAYVNVSQFPLEMDRYFAWLGDAASVDSVFFIHDLLPLQTPEYFRPSEEPRHRRRLTTLAKRARAVIVSTQAVADALAAQMAPLGRSDLAIHVAALPPDPIFAKRDKLGGVITRHPYFVMCGTIEPRKNHLLVLHIWRELVAELGANAPKLVLIGARGWENEHIIDLLERCPGLSDHVIEASGLPTPSMKRLMLGARALLMPSFAEGYGLPIVEALSAGVPVIASSIPVFREIGGEWIQAIDPLDGPGWRAAIRGFVSEKPEERQARISRLEGFRPPDWTHFFEGIEDFLEGLPQRAARG
jgi:glycosyltransferase involved in cell wall biosynthesis